MWQTPTALNSRSEESSDCEQRPKSARRTAVTHPNDLLAVGDNNATWRWIKGIFPWSFASWSMESPFLRSQNCQLVEGPTAWTQLAGCWFVGMVQLGRGERRDFPGIIPIVNQSLAVCICTSWCEHKSKPDYSLTNRAQIWEIMSTVAFLTWKNVHVVNYT